MKTKISLLTLVILALFANPTVSVGQQTTQPSRDWAVVRAVPSGHKLAVWLKDGKKVEGRLRNVSDTTLTLDRGKKPVDLHQDSIERVYLLVKGSFGKSVGKSTAIGAGIGFGIGAGSGVVLGSQEDFATLETIAVLAGSGAAIGALVGAVAGAFGSKQRRVLIYSVK